MGSLLLTLLLMTGPALSAESPSPTPAAPPKPKAAPLPPLLQEVETRYSKSATLEASFVQVNEVASVNTRKSSSGIIWLKRPNKLRWQTNDPDPSLLVSDGRKFWFYTPPFDPKEGGQLMIRKSSEVQTRLARALLSGSFSAARDMKIKELAPDRFQLVPRKGTAGTVKEALIVINLKTKLIEKLTLLHDGGNKVEITLSQVDLGKKLEDKMFTFVPPPGTEILKE